MAFIGTRLNKLGLEMEEVLRRENKGDDRVEDLVDANMVVNTGDGESCMQLQSWTVTEQGLSLHLA